LLHFILAGLVFNVNDTHNPRAKIQNQYWSGKILAWVGFLVISFFIPHVFFVYWSKYVALLGAGIFMLIQLLLLIDFTHSWAERCLENWENDNNDKWKWILVGSTLSVFCISIVMIGLEYGFFSGHGCTLNQTVISINLVLAFIAVFLSIHPRVQDVNPKSGLTQAGIMVLYGTYLIASAMINEPTGDDEGGIAKHCNPMDKTASGKSINFAIGAIFTIIAIVYSTSRAATQSSTILASSPEYSSLPLSDPSSRSNAIQAAVNSGSISQSEANEDNGGHIVDDEETGVAYNYTFFHLVFAIASMYAAMLLTNWGDFHIDDSAVYIGRSMYALWVKVGTSWISYALFFWTLVAPILLPDRYFSLIIY
jgi:hypothetical protein